MIEGGIGVGLSHSIALKTCISHDVSMYIFEVSNYLYVFLIKTPKSASFPTPLTYANRFEIQKFHHPYKARRKAHTVLAFTEIRPCRRDMRRNDAIFVFVWRFETGCREGENKKRGHLQQQSSRAVSHAMQCFHYRSETLLIPSEQTTHSCNTCAWRKK